MPTAAWCAQCNSYTWVGADGGCASGHPRSSLRQLYETQPDPMTGQPLSPRASNLMPAASQGPAAPPPQPLGTGTIPIAPAASSPVQNLRAGFRRLDARVRGVVLLVIGLVLSKFQIYDPLHASELGLRTVTIHSTLVGLAVFFPMLGLAYIVVGSKLDEFLGGLRFDKNNLRARDVAVILMFAAPVCAIWFFIMQQLGAQGYH